MHFFPIFTHTSLLSKWHFYWMALFPHSKKVMGLFPRWAAYLEISCFVSTRAVLQEFQFSYYSPESVQLMLIKFYIALLNHRSCVMSNYCLCHECNLAGQHGGLVVCTVIAQQEIPGLIPGSALGLFEFACCPRVCGGLL